MGPMRGVVYVQVLTYCLLMSINCAFAKRNKASASLKVDSCSEKTLHTLSARCNKKKIKHTCSSDSTCDVCEIAALEMTGYASCKVHSCMPYLPGHVQFLQLQLHRRDKLSRTMLQNVTEVPITRLILRNCSGVENGSLKHMERLECVNLDFTDVNTETLIEVLNLPRLNKLSLRDTGLLHSMLLKDIVVNSTLSYLWLSDNNLRPPKENTDFTNLFQGFPNLKGLDLSSTSLVHFKGTHPFERLETLNLSDNNLKYFYGKCSLGPDANGLQSHGSFFPKLVTLDLSKNKLISFKRYYDNNFCFPSLRYLDLSANRITIVSALSWFNKDNFPALQILNLNSQQSNTLAVDVNILRHPILMELRLNNIKIDFYEEKVTFPTNVTQLRRLYLNDSNLNLVDEESFLAMFGHLRSLETLSLSGSKLGFVSCRAFSKWVNLTELNLSDNAISSIPDQCFDSLHLTRLDLSQNKLTAVSSQTFGDTLRAHLKILNLGQNPFVCSCELFWFKQWFLSDRLFSTSDPRYVCRYNHVTVQLGQFRMTEQVCLLSHDAKVLIIFSCSFIITVLTAVTLLYCYRWHLRLLLYETFRGRDDVRRRYLQQGKFIYDVFVSFDSGNMPWVFQYLMPELEGRQGLRLCVHVRDFIPGRNIVDNIVECVESSKKVLMLFSNHFVLSQWCQFELNLCLRHVMDYDDALIVACLDDVVSREMTSSMIAVLRTTTYLQWEEHGDAARAFWGRLTQALNEVMQHEEQVV